MPITLDELETIRANAFADDLPITPEMMQWTSSAACAYFESGGQEHPATQTAVKMPLQTPTPSVCTLYRVMHAYVNMRQEPSLRATTIGSKRNGELLEVDARGGTDLSWVRLVERPGGRTAWLLTDGRHAGIHESPALLQHVSGPLPPDVRLASNGQLGGPASPDVQATQGFASGFVRLAAPMEYEVVHSYVRVRMHPSSTAAEKCTMLRKGSIVSATARHGDWVQLEESPFLHPTGSAGSADGQHAWAGGWMLTDGKSMSPPLGILMQPHITSVAKDTSWQVTRSGVIMGYPSPAGAAIGEPGKPLHYCVEGEFVQIRAECGMWVQVCSETESDGHGAWVELDAFLAG